MVGEAWPVVASEVLDASSEPPWLSMRTSPVSVVLVASAVLPFEKAMLDYLDHNTDILKTIRETEGMHELDAFKPDTANGIPVFLSEDSKEGPLAFKEKRAPQFKMR